MLFRLDRHVIALKERWNKIRYNQKPSKDILCWLLCHFNSPQSQWIKNGVAKDFIHSKDIYLTFSVVQVPY